MTRATLASRSTGFGLCLMATLLSPTLAQAMEVTVRPAAQILPASASERAAFGADEAAGDPARDLHRFLKDAFSGFEPESSSWQTRIEYSGRIDAAHEVRQAQIDGPHESAEFATIEKAFGDGGFQPLIGFGFGDVSGRFEDADRDGGLALTGVFGGVLKLTEEIGAVMKYGYTVATGGQAGTGGDAAHDLQIGLEIKLN